MVVKPSKCASDISEAEARTCETEEDFLRNS